MIVDVAGEIQRMALGGVGGGYAVSEGRISSVEVGMGGKEFGSPRDPYRLGIQPCEGI